MSITKKLFELQNEIGAIAKDATNPFYKSKYFDINSLIDTLKPFLEDKGLLLLQPIEDGKVRSVLIDIESDEFKASEMALPEIDDPQKMGSAVTYLRRYTLQSLLALQAEDDDGNKASGKTQRKTKSKPKPKKKPKVVEEPVEDGGDYMGKIDAFEDASDLVEWFNDQLDGIDDPDESEAFRNKYLGKVQEKAAELYD